MTPQAEERFERACLAVLLAGAWLLRALPFFRDGGATSWPVDYDEGVYTSSAHALWVGLEPWRDFVFVHPPAALFAFLPAVGLEPRDALAAIRWGTTLLGTVNVALVFLVVRSRTGLMGALLAAGLYATWPEVVQAERRALLEPLLNTGCLAAVLLLARGARPAAVGVVLGLAVSVKTWAALWIAGVIFALPTWRGRAELVAAVGATFALVCGWLLLSEPVEAFRHVVQLQTLRPPDGDASRALRLSEMFWARSPVPLLVLLASAWALWQARREPLARALVATFALIVAAFLGAAAWWNQYDAHLAAAFAPLVGLAAGLAVPTPRRWVLFALVLLWLPAIRVDVGVRRDRDPTQEALAARVRAAAPTGRVCAFEPADALLGGVWPAALFDSYGQALLDTARAGRRFPSVHEAFADEVSQPGLRTTLERCDVVVRGWRGSWEMNAATKARFDERFVELAPEVYRRR